MGGPECEGTLGGNRAVGFSSADCAYRLHYSEGGDTPHPVSPAACPFCLRRALQISGGSRADLGQTSGGPECCHPADRCMRRLLSGIGRPFPIASPRRVYSRLNGGLHTTNQGRSLTRKVTGEKPFVPSFSPFSPPALICRCAAPLRRYFCPVSCVVSRSAL